MNSIKYLSIVVLMISSTRMACIGADATTDPDLATPQATVLSYCKHGVFDLKSKYFSFPKNRASRAQTEKFT
ncbi:MAG: hypothetical protein KGL13_07850, partial [Gammaproteobacteria bacterium]|nr:hypothetical protein [Gammaproteobacteria bacterium]